MKGASPLYSNGGNLDKRDEYNRGKAIARKGDTVYLDALDRLGRNTEEIEKECRYFTEEISCYVVVMNMPLLDTRPREGVTDVSELISKIALAIFAWMAQKETEERKRRQKGGIEAAKAAGKYKGKPPMKIDKELFEKLYGEVKRKERTATYAMGKLGVTCNTWYVLVNEYETRTGRFK